MPNKKTQPTQKPLRVFRSADFKRYVVIELGTES
jgi:hypothetical protein